MLLLGIDISTTAAKALLINEAGSVVKSFSTPITISQARPLWSEQDPEEWWRGTVTSTRAVLQDMDPTQVRAIGLTGQMHGLVLLDQSGEVIRPAILWNDQRTAAQCQEIRVRIGRERLLEITGNDALPGFTAPKVLWVQEHEPANWRETRHLLLPKDYVRYRLTGEHATDRADGSGTLLFDLVKRDWSAEVTTALGIPADYLPKTYEGPEVTGWLSDGAAESLGLPSGIPVVGGGGDQAAQAVGVGAVEPGIVAITLGTSGVAFATTDQPIVESEGRLHSFCHCVPGSWHLMGVMLSAGGSLRWYRDSLAPGVDYDRLLEPAGAIPEGCEGLLFLPYLTGERTPHPDPLARGAFVGLTGRHTQAHLTRSVLEGVAFGLRDSFELIRSQANIEMKEVRLSGGGTQSPLWRQILCDVLNTDLAVVNVTEGAAFGAALLAGVGIGVWPDVNAACRSVVETTHRYHPRSESASRYELQYQQYRRLYPALKDIFHGLGGQAGES
jgi:xylulokinase